VANASFSLITPEGQKNIEESSKDIKEKIGAERANILELVVEDATKYTMNDQLHLGFVSTIFYLFCCCTINTQGKTRFFEYLDLINQKMI
jgi:hypothetical protein